MAGRCHKTQNILQILYFWCLKIEVGINLFYPSPDKEVFKFLKFLFVEKFNEKLCKISPNSVIIVKSRGKYPTIIWTNED